MGTVRYTAVNGQILGESRGGSYKTYIPDALGSTVALKDSAGALTDTFRYWPYGEERARTGTTATALRSGGCIGYYRDSSSRSYVRARVLRPALGAWGTQDPVGQLFGDGFYPYAGGSPLVLVDPSGLVPLLGEITVMQATADPPIDNPYPPPPEQTPPRPKPKPPIPPRKKPKPPLPPGGTRGECRVRLDPPFNLFDDVLKPIGGGGLEDRLRGLPGRITIGITGEIGIGGGGKGGWRGSVRGGFEDKPFVPGGPRFTIGIEVRF
jgi:RHS repeat-associated protein